MCINIYIRRYSLGPFYYIGQSTPLEIIYLLQDYLKRNLLSQARELAYNFYCWLYRGYNTPNHWPLNKGHPPTYNNNLENGPLTPLNKEDCLDLIFKDKDKRYYFLSMGVGVKSFRGVNSKQIIYINLLYFTNAIIVNFK